MLRYFVCARRSSKERPVVIISDGQLSYSEMMDKVRKYFHTTIADMMPESVREISYREFIEDPNCFTFNYL